jgi:hypothetical protein
MKSVLIIALLILNGCASFDEVIYVGMHKADFRKQMSFNEMGGWAPIYYDANSKIEIAHAVNSFNGSEVGNFVIFEDVSYPNHSWWPMQGMRVPKGCDDGGWSSDCRWSGDGVVRSWHNENDVLLRASQGGTDTNLLVAFFQLYLESQEAKVNQIIMKYSLSREAAQKRLLKDRTNEYYKYERIAHKQWAANWSPEHTQDHDLKNSTVSSQSQTYTYYDPEYDAYRTVNSQPIQKPQVRSKVSSSLGPLFGRLIEAVLDAYIDEKLGLNTSNSNLSKSDLERIEEASRKGMRRAIKQQKRKDGMKWTAPIR